MIQNPPRKSVLRKVILTIAVIAFLGLTFAISWKIFEKRAEEDVLNTNQEYFPIVVITPNKSELVFLGKLEKYKQDNPNYSFLIPKRKEDLINKQLREDQIRRNGKGTPRISAKTDAEGKQLVEFEIIGDGLFLSRYEVKDKEIKPLTLTLTGPLFVIFPCGTTIFLGLGGFLLLQFILWRLKKNKILK